MKISIITVVYNGVDTIEDAIKSVKAQSHPNIEHIIIDGASTDGTLDIIKKYQSSLGCYISEYDNGLYDAMNKGIKLATGDIVGILNSDDMYYDNECLKYVNDEFVKQDFDSIYADMVYVRPDNLDNVVRYYRSAGFNTKKFAYGFMPAHPTFFVKRECYEKYGYFKTDYRIAADFELLLRFLVANNVSYKYVPKILVRMRTGGVSTRNLMSNYIINQELVRACKENGVDTNILKVLTKYITKWLQLINRPK